MSRRAIVLVACLSVGVFAVPATAQTISSAANQTFAVGDASTAASAMTITDDPGGAKIKNKQDIRVRIPAGMNMTWDATVTTATITGSGASKVATTVTYANGNKDLVINVITNFAPGDQIVVSGLRFTSFTAPSAAGRLGLIIGGAGGAVVDTDDKTKTILAAISVAVSPHSAAASRVPSNGTNYTAVFTVQNTGSATDSYDLLTTRQPGTVLTTVSITGAGITQGGNPDSARLANVTAGASVAATVTYSVAGAAPGALDTLSFTARSVASPTHSDRGRLTVTVMRPNLAFSKGVSPAGTQIPGTDLRYTATLSNNGSSSAWSIVAVDTLPATVQLKVGSVATSLPPGVSVIVEYSNNGGATWTYTPASGACGAPVNYDRCVNRVRWRLQNPLSSSPPDNTGSLELIASIR